MENDIFKHRAFVAQNILKSMGADEMMLEKAEDLELANPFEVAEYEASLTKAELEEFNKAHKEGDMHPNGKWVWKILPNGKGDWRVANPKRGGGPRKQAPQAAAPQANQAPQSNAAPQANTAPKGKRTPPKAAPAPAPAPKNTDTGSSSQGVIKIGYVEEQEIYDMRAWMKGKNSFNFSYDDQKKVLSFLGKVPHKFHSSDRNLINRVNKTLDNLYVEIGKIKNPKLSPHTQVNRMHQAYSQSIKNKTTQESQSAGGAPDTMVEVHKELANKFEQENEPFTYTSNGVSDLKRDGKKGYATWVGFEHVMRGRQPVDKNKMQKFISNTAIDQFLSVVNEKSGKKYTAKDVKVDDRWNTTDMYRLYIEAE